MTANPTMSTDIPGAPPREEIRRLHRSTTNRVLAGVCGGIAETYGSDPTAVRLATLVIGLFTGIFPMLMLYVVAALVIPDRGTATVGEIAPLAPGRGAVVFGVILILIGIGSVANQWFQIDWNQIWPVVLVGLGGVILLAGVRR